MSGLDALSFVQPWILLALVALPVLWWLLKLMPPAPKRILFPAIRLLFGLDPREGTPQRTPPWLILLRLMLATLVILALAHPLLNSAARLPAGGPLLVVVDDGWAAAARWQARAQTIADLIDQAEREELPVALLTTAPRADGTQSAVVGPLAAADARKLAQAISPQPWPTDRQAALAALDRAGLDNGTTAIWLTDGLAGAGGDDAFIAKLRQFGAVRVVRDAAEDLALLQLAPVPETQSLTLRLFRASDLGERIVTVRATGDDGQLITREEIRFAAGETAAEQPLVLPIELRNRLSRLSIEGEETAGGVILLDDRWRQRPVGLAAGDSEGEAQPLLSDLYYLERALAPFGEIRRGDIATLLQRELAVLMLADIGVLTPSETEQLTTWVERGGVLVRFAGERLAQNADTLLPVQLRSGERTLGGAMSWARPAGLAPFPEASPFAGLAIPPDVVVRRQVLAEPEPELGGKTWARLADGTPLVTGERRGDGWLVLVHTTANTDWSNLSLSGLFVDLMRRIVSLSQGVVGAGPAGLLPPLETLDGFGRLGEPPAGAVPASATVLEAGETGPRHPPGYYGRELERRALNLSAGVARLVALPAMPAGVAEDGYVEARETDLKPWLLTAALLLLLIDTVIALALRGLLHLRRAGAAAALALALAGGDPALAQSPPDDDFAIAATADTRLAYIRTGVPSVDATSNAGLQGLSLVLNQRTAVEAPAPLGVDVEQDELAFFPLLYWPVTPDQADLSEPALRKLGEYLRNGGTILFDTRDQNASGGFSNVGPGTQRLRELVRGLDIPPLTPVAPDHVLTKAFYLLQDFPGRWTGGTVWVEQNEGRVNDGVSSVIIGSNDWAAAWAVDDTGRPLFAAVPGGERQRELAYRFGVNLVMYALTGNYKSDQVHVPAILERLGQ